MSSLFFSSCYLVFGVCVISSLFLFSFLILSLLFSTNKKISLICGFYFLGFSLPLSLLMLMLKIILCKTKIKQNKKTQKYSEEKK